MLFLHCTAALLHHEKSENPDTAFATTGVVRRGVYVGLLDTNLASYNRKVSPLLKVFYKAETKAYFLFPLSLIFLKGFPEVQLKSDYTWN